MLLDKQSTFGGKFWSTHISRIQRLQPGHAHQNWPQTNPRSWSYNSADKHSGEKKTKLAHQPKEVGLTKKTEEQIS